MPKIRKPEKKQGGTKRADIHRNIYIHTERKEKRFPRSTKETKHTGKPARVRVGGRTVSRNFPQDPRSNPPSPRKAHPPLSQQALELFPSPRHNIDKHAVAITHARLRVNSTRLLSNAEESTLAPRRLRDAIRSQLSRQPFPHALRGRRASDTADGRAVVLTTARVLRFTLVHPGDLLEFGRNKKRGRSHKGSAEFPACLLVGVWDRGAW